MLQKEIMIHKLEHVVSMFLFDLKCGFMIFGCEHRSGKLWTCSHHDCKVATLDFKRNKSRGFFPVMCNTDHCRDFSFYRGLHQQQWCDRPKKNIEGSSAAGFGDQWSQMILNHPHRQTCGMCILIPTFDLFKNRGYSTVVLYVAYSVTSGTTSYNNCISRSPDHSSVPLTSATCLSEGYLSFTVSDVSHALLQSPIIQS